MNKPTFKEKQKTLFERQKKLRDNPTPAEVIFMQRLLDYNIDFIFQKCFIAKDYYCIVDFYLPKPFKVVFEIDGDYHDSTEQKKKDYARDIYLRDVRGFSVIRIKNEDVNVFPLESFLFNP